VKFAAVYQEVLNRPPFADAPHAAVGVWLRLAAAAAKAETDTLPLTRLSSARALMLCAGVTQEDVEAATEASLCKWVDGGLFVEAYDYHGQRLVESKRANGAKSKGRPKKPAISEPENLPVNRSVKRTETEAKPPSLPLPSSPPLPVPSIRSFGSEQTNVPEPKTKTNPGNQAVIPGLVSVPLPGEADPEVPRAAAAPPRPPRYTEVFEAIWAVTGRRGGKDAAHRAWVKVGRPPLDLVAASWSAYMLSDRPAAGFVKDLSTWFNGKCHNQEWLPARPRNGAARSNGVGYAGVSSGAFKAGRVGL